MSDATIPSQASAAVFLSYAREDAAAAQRIAEALRAAGVEVWFDQSELRGGDAWDQKIRTQIKECALFMPIISGNTQSRHEGYFRLEWRLADRRTELMGKSRPFLVPVCIDATRDGDADVPDSFLAVQWMRLANGEANHAFCERVKILLSPPAETGRTRFIQREEAVAVRGEGTAPPTPAKVGRPFRGRRVWFAGVTAAFVSLGALGWKFLHRGAVSEQSTEAARRSAPPSTEKSAAAMSEARQLVAKAQALFENRNATRDDLTLAEDYCRQALKLDSNDAEVWAIHSELDSSFIGHGADTSPERIESGRMRAERAVKLDPRSTEARLAKAIYLRRTSGPGQPEAEKILRELSVETPNDPRVLIHLGKLVWGAAGTGRNLLRADEALGFYDRAAAIPAGRAEALSERAWLLTNLCRYDEAESAIDESLRLQSNAGTLGTKIALEGVQGKIEAALAAVAQLPGDTLHSDYAGLAIWTWLQAREPEKVLQLLNSIPRDYLSSALVSGATDLWRGLAYQMMNGRADAARTAFESALQVVEKRLRDRPRDPGLLMERTYLLAYLGQRDAAATTLRLLEQMYSTPDMFVMSQVHALGAHALLDPPDTVIARLEEMLQGTKSNFLSTDFRFAMLRGNPRFEALIERLKPVSSANKSTPADKSIAVLAFANFGGDKENEYFSDGITEELLNVLAKVPGLRVAARTSAFYFKDKNVPIPEIAQKLNVAYVVEGSVQKSGTRVKITAQLIKASDGFHVWSDTFTRELKDVFAMQDEIAGLIAKQLQLSLGDAPRAAKTVNPEAHRLVLEGRYFWNQRNDEAFKRAEAAFMKAIELDPNYAQAHSGLAGVCIIRELYHQLDGFNVNVNADDTARAWSEAKRAIDLDPEFAEPHAVLGYAWLNQRGHLRDSEEEFQRAVALNPSDPVVRCWHAMALSTQGRIDLAHPEYEKAVELDPLWFINLQVFGWDLALMRRYEEALGILARASTLRSEIFIPNRARNARLLFIAGRKDEAVAAAHEVLRNLDIHPRWDADSDALVVLMAAGLTAEASRFADEVMKRLPPDCYLRGFVLTALGKFDEALPFLGQTPVAMTRSFFWDTKWDFCRGDPRWTQLMAKLGCAEEYQVGRDVLARMIKEQAAKK